MWRVFMALLLAIARVGGETRQGLVAGGGGGRWRGKQAQRVLTPEVLLTEDWRDTLGRREKEKQDAH